jgi:hypothetical protein
MFVEVLAAGEAETWERCRHVKRDKIRRAKMNIN